MAHVEIDGKVETVHVKNTGRCRELLLPGAEVFLTEPGTLGRKTRYDLVAVRKKNGILFNPFSVEIMKKVLARIRESYDGREMLLFFYYPSDEYVAWLMTMEDMMFVDDIDCRDMAFVIMQRYNRPRILRIAERKRR